jgi:NAD(P)-dependent dehydrogenase (short-subunit alcohol dehydrogenase family)
VDGHIAVVTGAGTGIGRAAAEGFARAGAAVAIVGRRVGPLEETAAILRAAGSEVLVLPADVADEAAVAAVFERVATVLGPVDVLINNAAIAGPVAPIWEQDLAGWTDTLRINLTGPWLCSREAARQMIPRRSGRIIHVGSISGKRPLRNRTPYCASKLGLVGMSRTLALELAPHGITVNTVSPGPVETPRVEELARQWGRTVDEQRAAMVASCALGRMSTPEEVAGAILFLASDGARNITGIDLTVDGGTWMQ